MDKFLRLAPLIGVATFLLALTGFIVERVVWAAKVDERVTQVEDTLDNRAPLDQRFIATEQAVKDLKETVVEGFDRLEINQQLLEMKQQRIEDKIDDLRSR